MSIFADHDSGLVHDAVGRLERDGTQLFLCTFFPSIDLFATQVTPMNTISLVDAPGRTVFLLKRMKLVPGRRGR